MCGEQSSRSKGQAKLNLSWEEFEVVQRPMKCLLTLGTCHYNEPPLPSACVCPTTPSALFLPTSHPRYGQQGLIEQLQAPSGEFPLFSLLFANNPPPSPRAMLAASTQPCTLCFKSHQPPPHKCNPQISPAPRINHPRQWNRPTKMPQQMESSAEAH